MAAPAAMRLALVLLPLIASVVLYRQDSAGYRTAGEKSDARWTVVTVEFQAGAPIGEINQALAARKIKVISGPDALGRFTLQLPVAPSDEPAIHRAMRDLTNQRNLILDVQRKE
jgi:hypothetical protein